MRLGHKTVILAAGSALAALGNPAAEWGAAPAGAALARSGSPESALVAEFGSGWLGQCFLSLARRESRMRPDAANWSDRHSDGSRGSFGLLQIGAVHRRSGESVASFARRMFDPAENARLGHALYRGSGLRPWGGSCGGGHHAGV